MPKNIRHKFSFTAADNTRTLHTLHVYAEIIDVGDFDDPSAEAEGLKQIRTTNGDSVNRVAKGRYQVVGSGLNLTSDDPNAP